MIRAIEITSHGVWMIHLLIGCLPAFTFPRSSRHPYDDGLRFVVLSPVHHHLWKKENTLAVKAALETLENHRAQPRINRNRLVFFAVDESAVIALYNQTRWHLAWQSIINEKVELNLDQHRMKKASKNQKEA